MRTKVGPQKLDRSEGVSGGGSPSVTRARGSLLSQVGATLEALWWWLWVQDRPEEVFRIGILHDFGSVPLRRSPHRGSRQVEAV